MGKRGPKPKFTNVACPNESCRDHLVIGKGVPLQKIQKNM